MNLTEKIKAIRKQKNLTQSDLSERLGIDRANYHRLENRGDKLSIEQLKTIAKALDVSVAELLNFGSEEELVVKSEELAQLEEQLKHVPQLVEQVNRMRAELALYEVLADGYLGFVMQGMKAKLANARKANDLSELMRSLSDDERAAVGIGKTAFLQTLEKYDGVIGKIIEQRVLKNKDLREFHADLTAFVEKTLGTHTGSEQKRPSEGPGREGEGE